MAIEEPSYKLLLQEERMEQESRSTQFYKAILGSHKELR